MKQEELVALLSRPLISVAEMKAVIGLSQYSAYAAVKRGDIPTVRIGRLIKVPTAPLRKMLGLEAGAVA
jgi:hypothetical protein